MSNTIQITFQNALDQAKRLDDCATELRSVQRRITDLKGNLRQQWSGEAADLFQQKCDALMAKVGGTESDLTQIAGVIRRTAKTFYDAEQAAAQIAQTRTSGGMGGR